MSNIVNDLVEEYIRETLAEKDGLLKELEDYAHENSVPIIHKEVSDLLKVILKIHRPKRILEIGCAIGYSSIFFASVLGGDVEIITIHKEVSDLLKVILKIHRPKRILEIGCAIGYSSIFFASVLGGDVEIITTERNEVMIEKAKENIKRAGLEDKITILEGDAEETLKTIDGEFDMIFIDAAKGQYQLFFDLVNYS